MEQQALQTAKDIRTGATSKNPDDKQLEQLRTKLSEVVQKAFEKRQAMQDEEVKQLKERLAKVEATVAKRNEHRRR